jgi:hypothetical protein
MALSAPCPAQLPKLNPTKIVDCEHDQNDNPTRSNKVQTQTFTSSTGIRAFAVVSADIETGCRARASLYVAEAGEDFRLLKQLDDYTPMGIENGTGVDGMFWSPSGRYLAVNFTHWGMASDASTEDEYYVFDFRSKRELTLTPMSQNASDQIMADCDGEIALSGWIDERHLRLRAVRVPYIDEERPELLKRCNGKPFELSYEFASGNITRLNTRTRN